MHVPKDADMIVLDYSINDDSNVMPIMDNSVRRPFERLLRKLLNYPKCARSVLKGGGRGAAEQGEVDEWLVGWGGLQGALGMTISEVYP